MTDTSKEAVERTTTPDIEAIRKRMETGWRDQTAATASPYDRISLARADATALLSHIAAQEAERKGLVESCIKTVEDALRYDMHGDTYFEETNAEDVIAAYLAQKEKK